jgi:hypothetical protein
MDRSPTPPRLPHIHGTTRAAAGKKERALLRLRKNQEKETISAQRFCGTDGEHKGRGNGKKRRSSLSLEGICDRKDRRARGEKTGVLRCKPCSGKPLILSGGWSIQRPRSRLVLAFSRGQRRRGEELKIRGEREEGSGVFCLLF